MIIACKLCPFRVEMKSLPHIVSFDPDQLRILGAIAKHIQTIHPQESQDIMMMTGAFTAHLMFQLVDIPASEKVLIEALAKNKAAIQEFLEAQPVIATATEIH